MMGCVIAFGVGMIAFLVLSLQKKPFLFNITLMLGITRVALSIFTKEIEFPKHVVFVMTILASLVYALSVFVFDKN